MISLPFQGLFPPGQGATIGVDFMIKTLEVDGDKVKVVFRFTKKVPSMFFFSFLACASLMSTCLLCFTPAMPAADLGHRWSREIPLHHTELL